MISAQTWNVRDYATNAPFVPELGKAVVDLLTLAPPARVLDLGCGDGVLSQALVNRGYTVLGVDSSPAMVRAAEARGIDAQVGDGEDLPFAAPEFDAVFSNAALHWMKQPDSVLSGVARALKTGGQFAGEFGGHGNVRRVVTALVRSLAARGVSGSACVPWYFPTPGEYATRLERAGFRVDFIAFFERPTALPGDVCDWIATFGESFTRALPAGERADYLAEVRAQLTGELLDAHGGWLLDYVRLRFRATKL